MKDLLRKVAPVLLVGGLLLANLASIRSEPPAPRPPKVEKVAPTPEQALPALPGRILFHDGDSIAVLERQRLRRVPLPHRFALPLPIETALSPDGRLLAGFTRQGEMLFVDSVDLARNGEVTRYLVVDTVGEVRWAPNGHVLISWSGSTLFARKRLELPDAINEAVWSPDGRYVAIETAGRSTGASLHQLDIWTNEISPLAEQARHPVWLAEGLLFVRGQDELTLRRPDGQESPILNRHSWSKAQVVDLRGGESTIPPGAEPSIEWLGGSTRPDALLFSVFFHGPDPGFGVGEIGLDGAIRLWLLPREQGQPGEGLRICQPNHLKLTANGLFIAVGGPICGTDLYRIDLTTGSIERFTENRVLVGAGGRGLLNATGTYPLATLLGAPGPGVPLRLAGYPLLWDEGAR